MDPYQPMVFDNRPHVAQFIDGGPITDGMANLAAALFQAPLAAAQIRRQREADQLGQLWRQKEFDRQTAQDQLSRLWHDQASIRQADQDQRAAEFQQAQIENMRADNVRRTMGMVGTGINNAAARAIDAAKTIGGFFKGRGQSTPAANLWYIFRGEDGKPYKVNRQTGEIAPATATPTEPIAALPVATPEDTAHRMGVIQQTNPTLHALMTRAPIPGSQAAMPGQTDGRSPEWAAAKIDMGGMDQWHQLAKSNPQSFGQQIAQLKAANDPRYPLIIAELRRRATGP